MKLLDLPNDFQLRKNTFGVGDDFLSYTDGNEWTKLAADSGASVAASNAAGGVLLLTTGGTNNNEALVKTTQKIFLFANNKPLVYRTRFKYTEANTDDANVFLGFSSAAAADLLVDDGAGPASNHSACGIFKVDGGTNWKVHCSLGTTQESVELTAAASLDKVLKAAGGSSYVWYELQIRSISSTQVEANHFLDGIHVYKQTFVYTSAVVMNACAYIKAGGSNSEVLYIDRIDAFQSR